MLNDLDKNAIDYIKQKEPLHNYLNNGYLFYSFTYPKTKKQIDDEFNFFVQANPNIPIKKIHIKNYVNCILTKDKNHRIITEDEQEFKQQNFRYEITPEDITISTNAIKKILNNEKVKIDYDEMYTEIKKEIKKYVYLKLEQEYDIITLYILLTYIYLLIDFMPILHLNGDGGTGKSQIVKIMSKLGFNSTLTISATKSSFFRLIDKKRGLYGMDEKEQLEEHEKELLNGCTYEGNIHTLTEKIGDTLQVTKFNIYTPVVLACINEIYGATSTRTLKLETLKAPKNLDKKYGIIRVSEDKKEWQNIRDNIIFFWLDNQNIIKDLMKTDEEMLKILSNRNVDVWKSLINLSKFFKKEKEIYKYINDYYLEQIEEHHENDIDVKFYQFLYKLNNTDWVQAKNIYKDFIDYELTEKQREFFTLTKFGKLMRKLGYSKTNLNKKKTYDGYEYKLDKTLVEKYVKNTYDFAEQLLKNKNEQTIQEEFIKT